MYVHAFHELIHDYIYNDVGTGIWFGLHQESRERKAHLIGTYCIQYKWNSIIFPMFIFFFFFFCQLYYQSSVMSINVLLLDSRTCILSNYNDSLIKERPRCIYVQDRRNKFYCYSGNWGSDRAFIHQNVGSFSRGQSCSFKYWQQVFYSIPNLVCLIDG